MYATQRDVMKPNMINRNVIHALICVCISLAVYSCMCVGAFVSLCGYDVYVCRRIFVVCYVFAYADPHVNVYVDVYADVYLRICLHICIFICMHEFMHVSMNVCMHEFMFVSTSTESVLSPA